MRRVLDFRRNIILCKVSLRTFLIASFLLKKIYLHTVGSVATTLNFLTNCGLFRLMRLMRSRQTAILVNNHF